MRSTSLAPGPPSCTSRRVCVGLAASELCTSQALTQTAPARERVDTDNAFAVVQVGRCMPSGLLGGGRSLKETPPASPLSSDADDDDADSDPELAHDDDAVADDADADDVDDDDADDDPEVPDDDDADADDVDDDDADDDPELAAAIAASLVTNSAPLSQAAMRQARLARIERDDVHRCVARLLQLLTQRDSPDPLALGLLRHREGDRAEWRGFAWCASGPRNNRAPLWRTPSAAMTASTWTGLRAVEALRVRLRGMIRSSPRLLQLRWSPTRLRSRRTRCAKLGSHASDECVWGSHCALLRAALNQGY